ncbi:MAG: methyltransferase [Desulfotomaculaceae bacterium]|nr:methyltransferase [Desulfotomaculaceae bacterium]MDD4766632.1 methyltransferase [Desulfotomaculaceae bacterium]
MMDESAFVVPRELLTLAAAVETGIIENLNNKPMSAAELARLMGADTRAVWVVTEALKTLGYLTKENGRLTLSSEAREIFYNTGSQVYKGFSFMHRYHVIRSWLTLPEVIFTGKAHPKDKNREKTQYFMSAMSLSARQHAPAVTGLCLEGIGQGAKVLDVGGGPLTYAKAFADLGANVTVLDTPEVVEYMSDFLRGEEKIEMVAGDFNQGLPAGPFSLVFLGNICHIYGEHQNRNLFKMAAQVLQPNGRIAILDFVRGTGVTAAVFGVNMLVSSVNGGAWTYDEYGQWLSDAGFYDVNLDSANDKQIIFAKKR